MNKTKNILKLTQKQYDQLRPPRPSMDIVAEVIYKGYLIPEFQKSYLYKKAEFIAIRDLRTDLCFGKFCEVQYGDVIEIVN